MTSGNVERRTVAVEGAVLEVFRAGATSNGIFVCAAHPATVFGAATAELLASISESGVCCINPRGLGGSTPPEPTSLEVMVDDLEAVRRAVGIDRWLFWGMSGGGWLAQLYAHRHPGALAGVVVESACLCFRERLADPSCALSPFFPAWRDGLSHHGLLLHDSHAQAAPADDAEWVEVEGVGPVFRRRGGPALLVSPMPVEPEMKRAMPRLWAFDSRSWIGELRLPALVIAGGADPVVPVHRVRAVHEHIAGSTFLCVEGAGHVPSAEQRPEAMAAVRAFVERARAP